MQLEKEYSLKVRLCDKKSTIIVTGTVLADSLSNAAFAALELARRHRPEFDKSITLTVRRVKPRRA
jgi:hypothetical protein